MSNRQRRKAQEQSQQLLGTTVHTAVPARGGLHPLGAFGIALAGVAAMAVVTAVVFGTVVVLGFIPIALAIQVVSPMRLVAICDQGYAVLERSMWSGRVKAVRGRYEFGHLVLGGPAVAHVRANVGPEPLWISKREVPNLAPTGGVVPGFAGA